MKHLSNVQQPPKVENKANKPKPPKGWKWIKVILLVLRFILKRILQDDDLGN
ncbi:MULTISPECIES: hypothetical protein [Acinetobacter]|uniref:hypothetical protein n=1 Tax=Acinetobacter TaxID=469 RepID=UPI0002B9BE07|nr:MULTISPECIES: hypothetical protein [Acinetobacter]EJB8468842.1 hypothetical protein [Acinetobacter baumannii]EJB8481810.1 hypothetical protein [Acinetobacter baumannii]EKU3412641.1 hypothetical protein [Acinetobacter baumannii]EKU4534167.1 hypothetical protein [Acinetobacter baumannii]EKU4538034.1 hypothetical protein [Acinetobacter baumannii]